MRRRQLYLAVPEAVEVYWLALKVLDTLSDFEEGNTPVMVLGGSGAEQLVNLREK